MKAFANTVLNKMVTTDTPFDKLRPILSQSRELHPTIALSTDYHRIGHTMLSPACPDLPYETLAAYMAKHLDTDITCASSGIINAGTYRDIIVFRHKYIVRGCMLILAFPQQPYSLSQTSPLIVSQGLLPSRLNASDDYAVVFNAKAETDQISDILLFLVSMENIKDIKVTINDFERWLIFWNSSLKKLPKKVSNCLLICFAKVI
jgi:hypothetical protein